MATSFIQQTKRPEMAAAIPQRVEGTRFDWLMAVGLSWFIGGLYLDGWAHSHIPQLETFFTPWHGVLYSGYFACALVLVAGLLLNHLRGYSWRAAAPVGYEMALLGVPLFLVGGVGDMTWHILFGIEKNTEALLSPTHLLLACSGFMIMSGPFRAIWQRLTSEARPGWRQLLPLLISLLAVYSLLTFFTEFAQPFVHLARVVSAVSDEEKSFGVADVLIQTAIMMGLILPLVKRWQLPFGALTLLLTINAALLGVFTYQFELIPCALVAGLVADILVARLQPASGRVAALRIFAFVVPVVLYLGYFLEVMALYGTTWTIHLWLGSCVIAGIVGLLLSYVHMLPIPSEIQTNA